MRALTAPPLMPTAAAASAAAAPLRPRPADAGHARRHGRRVHTGSVAVVDRDGRVAVRGRRPVVAHVHAQRAEAAAGAAVRRGRRRRALRLSRRRRSRCCARATPASRGTSTAVARHARQGRQHAPTDLQCGTHAPAFYEARGERAAAAAVFAARAQLLGQAQRDARVLRCTAAHQATTTSRSTIRCSRRSARRSRTSPVSPEATLVAGVDGCSAPNYAVPLAALALAFARLAADRRRPGLRTARRARWPTR